MHEIDDKERSSCASENQKQNWQQTLGLQLKKRHAQNLLRAQRSYNLVGSSVQVTQVLGQSSEKIVLFSTNDYLGLGSHADVRQAAAGASTAVGMGIRSAAIVAGHSSIHERLEQELARLKGTEECLLFPTGFSANLATIASLTASGDIEIFSDELNHASIIDGCRLARSRGARVHVYKHRDYVDLQSRLASCDRKSRKLVITDGVFSMDGDIADIQALARLKAQFGALLAVDDAHGTLVLGAHGGGVAEAAGVREAVDIHIGTLSKAFGAQGGFVACSRVMKSLLTNFGRSYIYSTALPVPVAAAALTALHVAHRETWRANHLTRLQQIVSTKLGVPVPTPIVPIIVGTASAALELTSLLLDKGYHVPAIRPPTVPEGQSRLRLSLSADHLVHDVISVLDIITNATTVVQSLQ